MNLAMSPALGSPIFSASAAAERPPSSRSRSSFRCRISQASSENETVSRREAAVLLSALFSPLVPFILQPRIASAFSIGISGPKEWLREQKKKSAKYLLAPIDASGNILQSAYESLTLGDADLGEIEMEEFQTKLVTASRDCVPENRNSFVAFQANTGVEVCTFRLIVKNASSLLSDRDPVKLEAESRLKDLIRSFSSLNVLATESGVQFVSNREKFTDAVKDAINSLNNFEQGVKDCLQI